MPRLRITINLAPADLPKEDSGFDLAIAVSILLASEQIPPSFTKTDAIIGELGLDGSTRAVRGIIGKVLAGRARGINTFYVPAANIKQAQLVPNVTIYPVTNLFELYNHLNKIGEIKPVETNDGLFEMPAEPPELESTLGDIVGQPFAKRALAIAAAGGHNVLFSGPPGTGKSMLAKALPSILPPLSHEEILEVTHLHSLATHNYEQIITERPFRAPHHSASHAAILGGGMNNLRPGEISLSHRGVLFFDELPEFNRATLEALRQPLEDRSISVARAKETVRYPANFILVATANPCPCGYFGTSSRCHCKAWQVLSYHNRLSGPILDRIDLYSDVSEIDHSKLLGRNNIDETAAETRQNVTRARAIQAWRYGRSNKLNCDMTNADIKKLAKLTGEAKEILDGAAARFKISARGYMRTIKVARTIADLDGSATIEEPHLSEALRYRNQRKSPL